MKHVFLGLCDGLIAHFLLFTYLFSFLTVWIPRYEDVMAVQSLPPHTCLSVPHQKNKKSLKAERDSNKQ